MRKWGKRFSAGFCVLIQIQIHVYWTCSWKAKNQNMSLSVFTVSYPSECVYIYLIVSLFKCVYLYLYLYLSVSVCVCVYMFVCLYLSVYVCLWVYICSYPSLSVQLCVCICLSVFVFVCLCLSVCTRLCLSNCVFISVCLCLYLSLSVSLFVPVSVCPTVRLYLSVCVCICLCLSACVFIYLSLCVSISVQGVLLVVATHRWSQWMSLIFTWPVTYMQSQPLTTCLQLSSMLEGFMKRRSQTRHCTDDSYPPARLDSESSLAYSWLDYRWDTHRHRHTYSQQTNLSISTTWFLFNLVTTHVLHLWSLLLVHLPGPLWKSLIALFGMLHVVYGTNSPLISASLVR